MKTTRPLVAIATVLVSARADAQQSATNGSRGLDAVPGTSQEAMVSPRAAQGAAPVASATPRATEHGENEDIRETPEAARRTLSTSRDEVTVTASRSTRATFATPVGTNVVYREQIERRPATTTADLLRDQAGIWTNGEGLRNTTPVIRGLMGNQVSLMVDGVRLNTAILFAGPNSFMQDIDPENIDRIEVVRGAGSVMWGTDALGGTVHIFTRPPPNWAEEGVRFSGRLSATLGSYNGTQRYRAEAGAATQNYRVRAGFTSTQVGDLWSPGPLGTQTPSGWRSRAIDLRGDARLRSDTTLTIELQDQQTDDAMSYDISLNRPEVASGTRRLALARVRSTPGLRALSSIEAQAYIQQQQSTTRRLDNGQESRRDVVTVAADVQARSVLFARHSLTYGLHFHADHAEGENANGAGARSRPFPENNWFNGAAFVAGDLTPIRWLTILPALRLDVFHLASRPDAISVPSGLTIEQLSVAQTNAAPTGSLGLVGHLLPWLNVVASASRGFRAPNASDQLSSGPFRTGYNFPSPGLRPESSWTFEGGARVRARDLITASATFFYTRIDDLITSARRDPSAMSTDCVDVNSNMRCDANEFVYVKTNSNRASMYGVELDATIDLPRNFQLYLAGTWMTGRDEQTNQALDRTSPTNATIGARFQPGRVYVDIWSRLVAPTSASEIPCDRLASDSGFRADPRNASSPLLGTLQRTTTNGVTTCSGELPGYVTFGARAGVFITSFIEARAQVTNISNANYRDKEARFDGAGIGVFGTLTIREPQ